MTEELLPASEDEACEHVQGAYASGVRLAIVGGATRRDVSSMMRLRSTRLCGIVDYAPAELVMTAQSGTPMNEIDTLLAANGQLLPFEPLDHRGITGAQGNPTIGGAFAVNASGPRRFVAGAARDSLLGVRFINGQGKTIRAGGRVMKNVTGLDLAKLLAGSFGSLGFVTEVTFKVLPAPESTATVVVHGLSDAAATDAMASAMAMPVEVSGAAHLPAAVSANVLSAALPRTGATALRVEGTRTSIATRVTMLRSAMSKLGAMTILGEVETAALWRDIRDAAPLRLDSTDILWRISVPPSAGHKLAAALACEADVDAYYDWQGGLVWLRVMDDLPDTRLRQLIRAHGGGHATLLRAPDAVRSKMSVFEPLPAPVAALSALVRQKLDPAGIFGWD